MISWYIKNPSKGEPFDQYFLYDEKSNELVNVSLGLKEDTIVEYYRHHAVGFSKELHSDPSKFVMNDFNEVVYGTRKLLFNDLFNPGECRYYFFEFDNDGRPGGHIYSGEVSRKPHLPKGIESHHIDQLARFGMDRQDQWVIEHGSTEAELASVILKACSVNPDAK